MAADLEVELKLEAEAGDLGGLADAPILRGIAFDSREQVSTYFDTPDRDLHAAGLSLRVRRSAGAYVQTVKAQGASAAGLFARPEWECALPGPEPDLADASSPLATLLPDPVLRAVAPVFTVEVTRRACRLRHADGDIEMVLDAGRIVADGASEPISEVELELKSGPPAALFALARSLAASAPLRLGVLAKAERGYRLTDRHRATSVKGTGAVIEGMTAAEAIQAIVGGCLRHFRLNEAILVQTRGSEALHQARVALRRLRSALSIFRSLLQDDRFPRLRAELRWLAATLGDARDIDVLLARSPDDLAEALGAARARAYADVLAALASERARSLMIDLSEWIAIGDWRTQAAHRGAGTAPADRFAAKTLDRLRRQVKRKGRDLVALTDERRHDVRILTKKLRYAAEFFVTLFPGKPATRRARAFLRALERLQRHLGDLNDIAHAPHVLSRLGIDLDHVLLSAERRQRLLRKAAAAHATLADAKPFWR